ncbi:hypothetical protein D9615_008888 [Tricholomella constricta]|uniref:HAT C-terminal dimerisation domain-containing protein n=1 Tax=Tricholomella constricta TaxID=117010 RepID=A0A8H5GZT4_9AGAR|nr:hypothetical protein D9615_008888 [Tricholomella constricta]
MTATYQLHVWTACGEGWYAGIGYKKASISTYCLHPYLSPLPTHPSPPTMSSRLTTARKNAPVADAKAAKSILAGPSTRSTRGKKRAVSEDESDAEEEEEEGDLRRRSTRKRTRRGSDIEGPAKGKGKVKAKAKAKAKSQVKGKRSKAVLVQEARDDDEEDTSDQEAGHPENTDDDDDGEGRGDEESMGGDDESRGGDDESRGSAAEPDLNEHQAQGIPAATPSKKESTRDILLIFSDRIKQTFQVGNTDQLETIEGRWCYLCKNETEKLLAAKKYTRKTLRSCFFRGHNSTCRGHIAAYHFEEYERRCKAAKPRIEMNFRCIPLAIKTEREANLVGKAKQVKLAFETVKRPTAEFTREAVVEAVAKHIACDNQALMLADKIRFRNCLVAMRPKAKKADLPTSHGVRLFLNNSFVKCLEELKADIQCAPGKVSCTADGWTADQTKLGYLGMTAHWIDVADETGKWNLRRAVVGFKLIQGTHAGSNLARVTLDNTSSNDTLCKTIESQHSLRQLPHWSATEHQLPCLEHVVNLANVDVMSHITKIAAVETTSAIWDYDPSDSDNTVLGGSLDVIAAIRTLAIKIQSSGQRIQHFEALQVKAGIETPLKITLHSNTRWGSAFNMLERAYKLRAAINLFISTADELFGFITTVQRDERIFKKIPWTAFSLSLEDWERVVEAQALLADSNRVLHHFSADKQPTLYRALPALEELQTVWEAKLANPKFVVYHAALQDSLDKLNKYYSRFDEKPAYILALVLHPYFKLQYIKLAWGGPDEQEAEKEAGNEDAKDWQDEARKIVEVEVYSIPFQSCISYAHQTLYQMAKYWKTRPKQASPRNTEATNTSSSSTNQDSFLSEFDRHRLTLLSMDCDEEWQAELRRYLKDVPADVTRDTDIIAWWSEHAKIYPTLARIALDILPSQASSVPCERVFSQSKLTATDRRSRLGPAIFEQLQILKAFWNDDLSNFAQDNTDEIEICVIEDFEALQTTDVEFCDWDAELDGYASEPVNFDWS